MTLGKLSAGAIVLAACLSLQGCIIVADGDGDYDYSSSDYRKQEEQNRQWIAALDDNATTTHVREKMGTPNFADRVTVDGVRYDVFYYRTHRVEADGDTTKDECTPVVFKDGVLMGSGEIALQQVPQVY
ncbi:hypothetical protein IDAT_09200 [Pseudidiomarina atlantica]|jgi:predicted ATP-grasp superfamily ATP-dependent carboligase|uniref:Lipoprotein n=1 Tax=Pseudidiomarina atlantica TaxID=1517416 RepID=A0A094IRK0_9GAMM|nr:DUF3192 domain-containing protein [Pseudidiomarina atlantica]KFZ28474.1 hypothetical protein IDAT_09200 [Pseudidiomarina atlantica]